MLQTSLGQTTGRRKSLSFPPFYTQQRLQQHPTQAQPEENAYCLEKRAIKPNVNNSEPQPKQMDGPESDAVMIFTGPPPNATKAEVHQWVLLWFQHHAHRITPEGIVQCLNPHQTTPQWIQTWVNNAHAHFARSPATNAPRDTTTGTTTAEAATGQNSLPIKQKLPTVDDTTAEMETPPTPTNVTATTTLPADAIDADTLQPDTSENAPIEIDAKGDTADDPIVIKESTSDSDSQ